MRAGERKLAFLMLLAEGPKTVEELARAMGITRDNVRSLARYYAAQGLVRRRRIGSRAVYEITERGLRRLEYLASRKVPQVREGR